MKETEERERSGFWGDAGRKDRRRDILREGEKVRDCRMEIAGLVLSKAK